MNDGKNYRLYDGKCDIPGYFLPLYGLLGENIEAICLLFTFTTNFQSFWWIFGDNMLAICSQFTFYA